MIHNNMPSVGIVIPNRDDSQYLAQCLNSVIQQTIRPDQIVFVDDDSSDDSIIIAHQLLDSFENVTFISNTECIGTINALNKGLSHIKTDYVLFLSSNDFMTNGMIEQVKNGLKTADNPGVFSAMIYLVNEQGNNPYLYPTPIVALKNSCFTGDQCIGLLNLVGSWFHGTTLFFHRESLLNIGGFDASLGGLADLQAALLLASQKGAFFSPEPFGIVRLHNDGCLTGTLSDLTHFEEINTKIKTTGIELSPKLFTDSFINKFESRLRFAALRSQDTHQSIEFPSTWKGIRYRLLRLVFTKPSFHKKTRNLISFLLLRPFDILPTIWYRIILILWIKYERQFEYPHTKSIKPG